ncbi:MAG: hypothetical protein QNJ65_24805 [Xenococcaceae cyanobacterium MO_234.B1]|nr:hypothetical protein [Xenococcaceae cyanobacterium MO_234.B1]
MEERFELYHQLIQKLLVCPEGEELELLQANSDLVDLGLLIAMHQAASYFAENDNSNAAQWLRNVAEELAKKMGFSSPDEMYQEYFNCFKEILNAVAENPSAEAIYPLLKNHLEKLNLNLGLVLNIWAQDTLSTLDAEQAQELAEVIANFGNLIQEFPSGNVAQNLELAIVAYQSILCVYN